MTSPPVAIGKPPSCIFECMRNPEGLRLAVLAGFGHILAADAEPPNVTVNLV